MSLSSETSLVERKCPRKCHKKVPKKVPGREWQVLSQMSSSFLTGLPVLREIFDFNFGFFKVQETASSFSFSGTVFNHRDRTGFWGLVLPKRAWHLVVCAEATIKIPWGKEIHDQAIGRIG